MRTKLSHCQTLRTSAALNETISEAAYQTRLSKSAWIRLVIERTLQQHAPKQETTLR